MKRARFTEEQIIAVLKEHEAGAKMADLVRKHGICEATFYNWKAKLRAAVVKKMVGRQARRGRAPEGRAGPVGAAGLLDRWSGSDNDPLSLLPAAGYGA